MMHRIFSKNKKNIEKLENVSTITGVQEIQVGESGDEIKKENCSSLDNISAIEIEIDKDEIDNFKRIEKKGNS